MPKKDKPRIKPDPTERIWGKDKVCAWFGRSPATIDRWIKERGFPKPRHDVNPSGLDAKRKNPRLAAQRDKADWYVTDILQWEQEHFGAHPSIPQPHHLTTANRVLDEIVGELHRVYGRPSD